MSRPAIEGSSKSSRSSYEGDEGGRTEDRALVSRFREAREETAFRVLYRRHAPALFRFATRLAGNREDGEDLLQETWIRAAARLGEFRWESSLPTWLCGIALNCWREIARSRARRAGGPSGYPPGVPLLPPPAPPEGAESSLDLERAIETLPDGYREVLVLHDLHGYTHEEIAEVLGVAAGTSKSQLSRARRALRERFRVESDPGGRDER